MTGAASGIGAAAVKLFLEAGAAGVVGVDLSDDLSANLAAVAAEHGPKLSLVAGWVPPLVVVVVARKGFCPVSSIACRL